MPQHVFADGRVWTGVITRPGFTFIDEVGSAEDGALYIRDVIEDRRDAGGWPTRDRAAPEEEC